jgi:hypothetical protein
MQRIHVDGGELECQNFSTWKKAISRSHEVNNQSTIIQNIIGEFIARAHQVANIFSLEPGPYSSSVGVGAALIP